MGESADEYSRQRILETVLTVELFNASFVVRRHLAGGDVGKGVLMMFVASIAILAFMWAVGALIGNRPT